MLPNDGTFTFMVASLLFRLLNVLFGFIPFVFPFSLSGHSFWHSCAQKSVAISDSVFRSGFVTFHCWIDLPLQVELVGCSASLEQMLWLSGKLEITRKETQSPALIGGVSFALRLD